MISEISFNTQPRESGLVIKTDMVHGAVLVAEKSCNTKSMFV